MGRIQQAIQQALGGIIPHRMQHDWVTSQRAIVTACRTWWQDWSQLLVVMVLAVSLVGCVDYDIGINFRSQTEGAIVQHVRVADRLSALDRETVRSWTDSLTRRAKDLGGHVRQLRNGDFEVTIPFINGDDLADKFDQFFGATETELFVVPEASSTFKAEELPKIASSLSIVQHNFLLAIRNDLSLDFDLRGLSLLSNLGRSPFQTESSQSSFIDLRFHLTTPWGLAALDPDTGVAAESQGLDTVWTLQPGEMQHIEASFWIPSPIGIGALAVLVLTAIGSTLKHRVFAKLWPKTHAV
jgi:Protein of unknown function (DUF3153)